MLEEKIYVSVRLRALLCLLWLVVLALPGCNPEASKVRERFLGALSRDDYPAAFAELHSDALVYTPDATALRERMSKSGIQIKAWSSNCGASGAMPRTGYNVTTQNRSGFATQKRPLIIGVAPERQGRCNGPLLLELKQESALPGAPWKVRSMQLE